jgi:hypothetical protein
MLEIILWVIVLAVLLAIVYRSAKSKNGFVRHFSRGAYMRDLNKQMEDNELK